VGRRFVGIALGVLCVARSAAADGEASARARAAFDRARKMIEAGDCLHAIPELEESLRHDPSVGAHLSLSECVDRGDPHRAWWELREAAVIAFAKKDDRYAFAEERAAALRPRIAMLRIEVPPRDLWAPGFELRIDGKPIDRGHLTGGDVAAPPGEHVVTASTADGRKFELRITSKIGTAALVVVDLLQPHPVAPAPMPVALVTAPTPPPPSQTKRNVGLVLLSTGVLAAAVGTGFGIVALQKRSELDRACNGDASRCTGSPRVVDPVVDSLDSNATASTIFFAAGATLVAAGVYFVLSAPRVQTAAFAW
jgi:hypothetical protein